MLSENARKHVKKAVEHAKPRGEEVQVTTPSGWPTPHVWEGQIEDRGSSQAARFTPIETRMSKQNGDATNQQAKKAQRVDPVGDADDGRMPRSIRNLLNSVREIGEVRGLCRSHAAIISPNSGKRVAALGTAYR